MIIELSEPITAAIGALGTQTFSRGFWIYVGSAMGMTSTSLEQRLGRHFNNSKTVHWHIDYLLRQVGELHSAVWAESSDREECRLGKSLLNHPKFKPGPRGFGSSDCISACGTHLFRYNGEDGPEQELFEVFLKNGLTPLIKQASDFG